MLIMDKMTDQEIQKIAEDLEIKLRGLETPNAVDDEDHETIHDFTLMRIEAITQSLIKVRDAQEDKLKIAREALEKIKSAKVECNDFDGVLSYVAESISTVSVAKEALERMGGE